MAHQYAAFSGASLRMLSKAGPLLFSAKTRVLIKTLAGIALMMISIALAIGFGPLVFFPVAVTSLICVILCVVEQDLASWVSRNRLEAGLMSDLLEADAERRAMVLAELQNAKTGFPLHEPTRFSGGAKAAAFCLPRGGLYASARMMAPVTMRLPPR